MKSRIWPLGLVALIHNAAQTCARAAWSGVSGARSRIASYRHWCRGKLTECNERLHARRLSKLLARAETLPRYQLRKRVTSWGTFFVIYKRVGLHWEYVDGSGAAHEEQMRLRFRQFTNPPPFDSETVIEEGG